MLRFYLFSVLFSSIVLAAEWETEHDGVRVFYKSWNPILTVARVIAIHGLS